MKNKTLIIVLFLLACVTISVAQGIRVIKTTDITIESGTYLKLISDQDFLLEANQTETASLIDRNSSCHILVSGSGKVRDECYVRKDKWHYVSSPVTNGLANTFFDIYLKEFDEEDSTWTYITDPSTPLTPLKGYATWASTALTGNKTVSFYGSNYNAGDVSINVTNHGAAGHNSKGFNFVGNPYPSAIDWQKPDGQGWNRTGIDPIFYLWNSANGNYGNYNRILKVGVNNVDSIIPANQGFFIHVTNSGQATLRVTNAARLHRSNTIYKTGKAEAECLTISAEANGYRDEAKVLLHPGSTTGYDHLYDASKLEGYSDAPQLYTFAGIERLSVNTFPEIEEEHIIPLGFEMDQNDEYCIEFEGADSFGDDVFIFLKNLKTGEIIPVETGTSYSFDYQLSDEIPGFHLIFKKSAHGLDEPEVIDPVIFADNGDIIIRFAEGQIVANERIRVSVYNIPGQRMYASGMTASTEMHLNLNLSDAYYLVNLVSEEFSITKKILVK